MNTEKNKISDQHSPFNLNNNSHYEQWRDKKLINYPKSLEDLVVEINDPRNLKASEQQKIIDVCRQTNMVIYRSNTADNPDPSIPVALGNTFGLIDMDHNWLADNSGVTSLTVVDDGARKHYIPYSNRAINWHTDGYYNTPDKQIRGMILHCVNPAPIGGGNQLMDHEMAYILLRDKNPDYIKALMLNDVMTIPPRMKDNGDIARKEETGPVFSIIPETGDLHVRYTIRTRNVIWKDDPLTQEALGYLSHCLKHSSDYIFNGTLESGMGLICNNVLHDRTAFEDNETQKRLLYRARYYNRMAGTSVIMG